MGENIMSNVNIDNEIKDKTFSHYAKLFLYLLARFVLVTVLSLMASPLAFKAPLFMNPVLGVFFLFALIYFFVLTCHFEGGRDRNRVETGLIRENKAKGFLCAGLLVAPLIAVGAVGTFTVGEGIGLKIARIVYSVSSFSTWNLAETFAWDDTATVIRFIVYAAVLSLCFISAGVAYRLGYED